MYASEEMERSILEILSVIISLYMFSVISVCIRKADVWLLLLVCHKNSMYFIWTSYLAILMILSANVGSE